MNSSARIERNEDKDTAKTTPWVTKGNVTEMGIITFFMNQFGDEKSAEEAGLAIQEAKKAAGSSDVTLDVIEFSSSRKRASVVVKHGNGVRVYTKGAPDMLFPKLRGVLDNNGDF